MAKSKATKIPPMLSSESFYNFGSSVQVFDPFRVHFCVWCEVGTQHHLWKGLFLFSLDSLGTLVENQLAVDISGLLSDFPS